MRVFFVLLVVVSLVNGSQHVKDAEDVTEVEPWQQDRPEYEEFPNELNEEAESVRKTVQDVPGLTDEMLIEVVDEAKREQEEENKRFPGDETLDDKEESLQAQHYKRFVPELEPVRFDALVMEKTTRKLAQKLGMTSKEAAMKLDGLESRHLHGNYGKRKLRCRLYSRFRSIDGSCNNPRKITSGAANTAFSRVLVSAYKDKISKPRAAHDDSELPNARKVSFTVFWDQDDESKKVSHMNMIWGQFIDHDIDHGGQPNISCAGTCGLKGECFGIPIPTDDPAFKRKGVKCIQLKRDVPAAARKLKAAREQINIKSSFIDASQIYGDALTRFNELRVPNSPLLQERENPSGGKNFLPKQGGFCRTPDIKTQPCFKSGDFRTNENPGLLSMHTLWSREHNRIATKLQELNPRWRSNKVFFETRKIVGAMLQHITYNEFLPLILDWRTRFHYGLVLQKSGFFRRYDSSIDPSIFNAFAAAAYRFGHSQIRNLAHRFGKNYDPVKPDIPMNRTFDPTFLYQSNKGGVDSIIRGFIRDASQKTDSFFSKAVQEELVRGPRDLSDLAAINIQRGREHGIPGYNSYREFCKLPKAKRFLDFRDVMTLRKIKRLASIYKNANDVDLFVGGLYEKPVRGGIMGKTFSCLLAEQFRRLRHGDRFWYENYSRRTGFTRCQLQALRKASLARVICDNGDGIKRVQKKVLGLEGRYNRLLPCKRILQVDLRNWRENAYFGRRRCW